MKPKLKLESLKVQSFVTQLGEDAKKVKAGEEVSADSNCIYSCMFECGSDSCVNTCQASCNGTCDTCETCGNTCDGTCVTCDPCYSVVVCTKPNQFFCA